MGNQCTTQAMSSCSSLSMACEKAGSCACNGLDQQEVSVTKFHRPTFVKWLTEQIQESLMEQQASGNTQHFTSSKYLYKPSSLMNLEEVKEVRETLFSRASTNRQSMLSSRQTSRYDNTSARKKQLGPDAVRKIILDAFKNFRDREIKPKKLKQFENKVFEDCYALAPEEAAQRILELIEQTEEDDMLETSMSTPQRVRASQNSLMGTSTTSAHRPLHRTSLESVTFH